MSWIWVLVGIEAMLITVIMVGVGNMAWGVWDLHRRNAICWCRGTCKCSSASGRQKGKLK